VQNVFFFLAQSVIFPGIELPTTVVAINLNFQKIAGIAGAAAAAPIHIIPGVIANPNGIIIAIFHYIDLVRIGAPTYKTPQC